MMTFLDFVTMIRHVGCGLLVWANLAAAAEGGGHSVGGVQTAGAMSRLVIGKPQIVYTDAQMPYTMDGSWATVRETNGSMTFFETAMGKKPYYFRHSGTSDHPLKQELAPFSWDYNGYNHTLPSGCWIQNIYRCSDGTLIGFAHREDLFPANRRKDGGNNFFIGLARSTDGGLHWKYLGDVIATRGNGAKNAFWANLGGVPYLIVDGWLHLYFNEHDGPTVSDSRFLAVARTKLDELVTAVAHERLPVFKKFSHGTWTEDGMTGLGSEIIPGSRFVHNASNVSFDFHSDATFCKPLGRYLITVQTHGGNTLLLYASTDAVDWQYAAQLDKFPDCTFPYSSIVSFNSADAADGHEVGSKFFIYYSRKAVKDYDQDTLCRITLSVKPSAERGQ
jgi:hypothetical protein